MSPGSCNLDLHLKPYEYAEAGIPHYWLVDLDPPAPSITMTAVSELLVVVDLPCSPLDRDDVLLVHKRRYSALFETEMEGHLHRYGVDSVRICGVRTDICVLHTTADLRNRDLPVTVAVHATATFDAPDHPAEAILQFALTRLQRILGAHLDHTAR